MVDSAPQELRTTPLPTAGVLLDHPAYTAMPDACTVYALERGRVLSCPLSRYWLPASLRETIMVGPGPFRSEAIASLRSMADHAWRMAPWVKVHVVPTAGHKRAVDHGSVGGFYRVGGTDYVSVGGVACHGPGLVILTADVAPTMLSTLCHEILHMIWDGHLSAGAIAILEAAVADGARWPGVYLAATEERVARMFASWCMCRVEGMPMASLDPDGPVTVEDIFQMIWSGEFADIRIREGAIPGMSEVLDRGRMPAYRGLPPVPPASMDVRAARTVLGWLRGGMAALVSGWRRMAAG